MVKLSRLMLASGGQSYINKVVISSMALSCEFVATGWPAAAANQIVVRVADAVVKLQVVFASRIVLRLSHPCETFNGPQSHKLRSSKSIRVALSRQYIVVV
jgi:hypothetical protein